MSNTMVSIVVPVYNMQKFLHKSLDSLVKQSYQNIEIIIIDDGSTDESRELCQKFANNYPELVRVVSKENGGLSSARNRGIDEAKGSYITFPDPDDWVEEKYIQTLVDLLEKNQCELSCIGHVIEYDEKSVIPNNNTGLLIMDAQKAIKALIEKPCIEGFAWNKLFDLTIIREHKLYFAEDVGTTEDLDFAYRYLKYVKKVAFDPSGVLYHYVQHPQGASQIRFSQKQMEGIHTYEKIISVYDADPYLIRLAKEEIFNVALNLYYALRTENISDRNAHTYLRNCLLENLSVYLKSRRYGYRRKLQGMTAVFFPQLFYRMKDLRRKA